jgi:hypothetical protein
MVEMSSQTPEGLFYKDTNSILEGTKKYPIAV